LIINGQTIGSIKLTISIVPQEEIPLYERDLLAENPAGREPSMSIAQNGIRADQLAIKEASKQLAMREEETKEATKRHT
jgi:hypothetical protein